MAPPAQRPILAAPTRPLPHLTNRRVDAQDTENLDFARHKLLTLKLRLFAGKGHSYTPEVDGLPPHDRPIAVFVDDAEHVLGITPEWLIACASAGVFVLIALPRHGVMMTSDDESDLDPSWASVADVILEVRHRGLANAALRPGEAELDLHYNRWGYLRTISALHQVHFSRFLEATSA